MVITLEGKGSGRFYLAWKLFEAAGRMLANGTVEIEIRAASETHNVPMSSAVVRSTKASAPLAG